MTEKNTLATILDSLVQRKPEQDSTMDNDGVSGTLPLPAKQDIHPDYIEWQWDDAHVFVNAFLSKPESNYYIEVNGITIDSDQAKTLGEVLLSASRWRDTWQVHAGLYLINDGRLRASPDKGHVSCEPNQTFQ